MENTKDKELIEKANQLHYSEWVLIDEYIAQSRSDETKVILSQISRKLYHEEEAVAGLN